MGEYWVAHVTLFVDCGHPSFGRSSRDRRKTIQWLSIKDGTFLRAVHKYLNVGVAYSVHFLNSVYPILSTARSLHLFYGRNV